MPSRALVEVIQSRPFLPQHEIGQVNGYALIEWAVENVGLRLVEALAFGSPEGGSREQNRGIGILPGSETEPFTSPFARHSDSVSLAAS
jgi:hypothetical protein